MAPMRQQPIPDDSFSEADAIRLVRGLAGGRLSRAPVDAAPQYAREVLARTVETEVIPRLLMAGRLKKLTESRRALPPDPLQVAELTRLVLTGTEPEASAYVDSMQQAGATAEALFLDLLTHTARRLGVMWEEDECDFTEVTLGVLRLNNVMRLISAAFDSDLEPGVAAPRALLVQAPGEQHGFGLAMVVHFFRRAGWNVRSEPVATRGDLVALVRKHWFGLVGISSSSSENMEELAAHIAALRDASCNPSVGIMVGGPPFIAHPHMAAMIGADGTAADGLTAVQQAQDLLAQRARDR